MLELVGDFETIRRGDSMAVWLFDICDIYTLEHHTFYDIASGLESITEESTLYFHNLKFDGSYLMDYFARQGYTWVDSPKLVKQPGDMYFLITSSAVWFYGVVMMKNGIKIKLYDSYKKIPLKVEVIAESYKLPILKGSIDYTMPRPEGYIPTPEEIAYIHNDTEIVARALKMHFDEGLREMTAPADAFKQLKKTVCDSHRKLGIMAMRDKNHPELDAYFRAAYNGGVSWVNPEIEGREVGAGVVYDNNSMYPGVMLNNPYPVYYPTKINRFTELDGYLWIARFKVHVKKKWGALPVLRTGGKWIENSYTGELTLTCIDYELMLSNYWTECEFIDGYRWAHSDDQLFKEFVSYWGNRKQVDKGGLRQIDKLMMNSSYGKFGLNPDRSRKRIEFDASKNYVRYPTMRGEDNNPLVEHGQCNNVAIAAFITAYARRELNNAVLHSTGFCYCDTDSVHLATYRLRDKIITPSFDGDIHPTRLGAWKKESEFMRAKYLRQKTYIEEQRYNVFDVKACGMPLTSKAYVRWDNLVNNFVMGATFPGKLTPRMRPGGVELEEGPFTIHEPNIRF